MALTKRERVIAEEVLLKLRRIRDHLNEDRRNHEMVDALLSFVFRELDDAIEFAEALLDDPDKVLGE